MQEKVFPISPRGAHVVALSGPGPINLVVRLARDNSHWYRQIRDQADVAVVADPARLSDLAIGQPLSVGWTTDGESGVELLARIGPRSAPVWLRRAEAPIIARARYRSRDRRRRGLVFLAEGLADRDVAIALALDEATHVGDRTNLEVDWRDVIDEAAEPGHKVLWTWHKGDELSGNLARRGAG